MDQNTLKKLFDDLSYIRTGGSLQELDAANYLKTYLEGKGLKAKLESFKVPDATIKSAKLFADGEQMPCLGYRLAKDSPEEGLTAPFYYLANWDEASLAKARGKIVLFIGFLNRFRYEDLVKHGAVGFIGTNGNLLENNEDIDDKELRPYVSKDLELLVGVNVNIKTAMELVNKAPKEVTLFLKQDRCTLTSHNVVTKIKGESDEEIVISAHYDSVPLSRGVYDNLSGSLGILAILERFLNTRPHYTLTFLWCGSEERGLLGSKAYVEKHAKKLDKIRLCINLDMIGTSLGYALMVGTCDIKLVHFVEYLALMHAYPLKALQGVYSSDSTPFADEGIPALSLARIAPQDDLIIHNRYDDFKYMSLDKMMEDIEFAYTLTKAMANASCLPVKRFIPDNMKEELDYYNCRKRRP